MVSKPSFQNTKQAYKMLAFKKDTSASSRTAVLTLAYKIASVAFNSLGSQKEEFIWNITSFVKGVPEASCYTTLYLLNFVFQ